MVLANRGSKYNSDGKNKICKGGVRAVLPPIHQTQAAANTIALLLRCAVLCCCRSLLFRLVAHVVLLRQT
jgi:hypothetical protein